MNRTDARILVALGFLLVFCILVTYFALSHGSDTNSVRIVSSANAADTSTDRVTVEEVYHDASITVYRLVDPTNGVVCYWTYREGNVSCQVILPGKYR